jgi:hypothetical protein
MSLSSSSYLSMYAFCRGFLTTQPALIPKRRGPPRVQINTDVESCPTCQTHRARSLRLSDLELPNLIDTVQRLILQTVRSNVRMHPTPDNLPSDYRVGSSQHCYATRHLMTDIGKKPSSITPLLHNRIIPTAQPPIPPLLLNPLSLWHLSSTSAEHPHIRSEACEQLITNR